MDHPNANAGSVMPFRGVWPTIGANVFIAPNAFVIGQVTIGDAASLWFNVVVRGDDHWVRIGARTNVQGRHDHPCVQGRAPDRDRQRRHDRSRRHPAWLHDRGSRHGRDRRDRARRRSGRKRRDRRGRRRRLARQPGQGRRDVGRLPRPS
ncbi:MAG: hypothetical protein WDO24_09725 [Pseudomonadota bacterium]